MIQKVPLCYIEGSVKTFDVPVKYGQNFLAISSLEKNRNIKAFVVECNVQAARHGWDSASQMFAVFSVDDPVAVLVLELHVAGLDRNPGRFRTRKNIGVALENARHLQHVK